MTIIALVLVINYYHINGLHLFGDTLNIYVSMCVYVKQDGGISTLNDKPLKSVEHFTYCSSDVSICKGKLLTSIDTLSIIRNFNIPGKNRISPGSNRFSIIVRMHLLEFNKVLVEKSWLELHKDAVCYSKKKNSGSSTHKKVVVWPLT